MNNSLVIYNIIEKTIKDKACQIPEPPIPSFPVRSEPKSPILLLSQYPPIKFQNNRQNQQTIQIQSFTLQLIPMIQHIFLVNQQLVKPLTAYNLPIAVQYNHPRQKSHPQLQCELLGNRKCDPRKPPKTVPQTICTIVQSYRYEFKHSRVTLLYPLDNPLQHRSLPHTSRAPVSSEVQPEIPKPQIPDPIHPGARRHQLPEPGQLVLHVASAQQQQQYQHSINNLNQLLQIEPAFAPEHQKDHFFRALSIMANNNASTPQFFYRNYWFKPNSMNMAWTFSLLRASESASMACCSWADRKVEGRYLASCCSAGMNSSNFCFSSALNSLSTRARASGVITSFRFVITVCIIRLWKF